MRDALGLAVGWLIVLYVIARACFSQAGWGTLFDAVCLTVVFAALVALALAHQRGG